MIYERDPKIEELLNGYIDGELTPDELAQVQRLIKDDKGIARRLTELERCRVLVNSLPPAEPPAHVISGIKEIVRSRTAERRINIENRRGQLHLWTRHMLAASLMVGMLGLFAAVIYEINRPVETDRTVAVAQPKPVVAPKITPVQPAKAVVAEESAIGIYSLQLQTTDFAGIDAYINKLLDNSTWLKYEAKKDNPGKSTYRVLCSKGALEALMTDLSPVWSKFDSATLVVQSAKIGQSVSVDQVKPEQVVDIAKQDNAESRVRLARDFASKNNIEQLVPDNKMLALKEKANPELIAIPKPSLTSSEKATAVAPKGANDQVQVDLSIVVAGSTLSTPLKTGPLTTSGQK